MLGCANPNFDSVGRALRLVGIREIANLLSVSRRR